MTLASSCAVPTKSSTLSEKNESNEPFRPSTLSLLTPYWFIILLPLLHELIRIYISLSSSSTSLDDSRRRINDLHLSYHPNTVRRTPTWPISWFIAIFESLQHSALPTCHQNTSPWYSMPEPLFKRSATSIATQNPDSDLIRKLWTSAHTSLPNWMRYLR